MGMLSIDNLSSGMLLAADVHDRSGRLLLKAGTLLSDKHIYIFRTWGVAEADIDGMEMEAGNPAGLHEIEPERWDAAESEIMPLFRHTDLTHPGMKALLHLGILRRIQHGDR
jgi:hypothetical protein